MPILPKVMPERHEYKPLSGPDQIRLLHLHRGVYVHQVRCELHHYALEDCPLYTAVSYTWGEEEPKMVILLDETQFTVRENLFSLLNYARQPDEDRLLWIDAICIDQDSNEERNHQVQLMGQIYSHENEVLAWLGSAEQHLTKSFELTFRTFQDLEDNLYESVIQNSRDFCKLTYWTRRWIIQEIVVAENVVIQHGDCRIPLSSIEKFFNSWEKLPPDPGGAFGQFWANAKTSGPALLCQHRFHARRNVQPPYSLVQLMRRYQGFECTDPRDKVYAMFNLMGQTRNHLCIDYNATLPSFFVEVFCFINRYESSPMYDVIGVGTLLKEALGLPHKFMSLEIQALLDQQKAVDKVTVSFFVRGRVVRQLPSKAAEYVELCRPLVRGLLALTQTTLLEEKTHLVVSPISAARSFGGSAHVVSRSELCGFVCGAAKRQGELIGLASCRVKDGDQIWQFHDTKVAFIVREVSDDPRSDGYMIVGRAYLIPQQDPARLDHFPNTPKSREGLKSHQIRLDSASLLNLVYWATPSTTE